MFVARDAEAGLRIGVSDEQAKQLFDRGNTVEDLHRIVRDLDTTNG